MHCQELHGVIFYQSTLSIHIKNNITVEPIKTRSPHSIELTSIYVSYAYDQANVNTG